MDLDHILDQALDEFEEQELENKTGSLLDGKEHHETPQEHALHEKKMQMLKMMADMENQESGHALRTTLKDLSSNKGGNEAVEDLFANLSSNFNTSFQPGYLPADVSDQSADISGADRTVAATLKMLADAQQGMEGFEAGKIEGVGEEMMEQMMQQFQALGDREDYNEVIDGVMRQLLSRDLMYEPIKQICVKFPEWLAYHKYKRTSHTSVTYTCTLYLSLNLFSSIFLLVFLQDLTWASVTI
jgi:peroxin-19